MRMPLQTQPVSSYFELIDCLYGSRDHARYVRIINTFIVWVGVRVYVFVDATPTPLARRKENEASISFVDSWIYTQVQG